VKAREHGVPVFFIRPKRVVAEAFFQLTTDEVEIIPDTPLRRRILGAYWSLCRFFTDLNHWWYDLRAVFLQEQRRALSAHVAAKAPSSDVRKALKRLRTSVDAKMRQLPTSKFEDPSVRPYYRRRDIVEPFPLTFREPALVKVREAARKAGLTPDSQIVTLHVREPGWKTGREVQFLKPWKARDDSTRNARVSSHILAIDHLVERGFTVVRMGDPSMAPFRRAGVIDMATATPRNDLLELYCLLNSRFIICGESGPLGVSYLTGTPSLAVNCTDPVSAFPIRRDSLYLLKTVIDRSTGKRLTLQDMLSEKYLRNLRNTTLFSYVENSPEDILAALKEMLALHASAPPESDAQRQYRELLTRVGVELRVKEGLNYIRKWGPDEGFMGHGRLVQFAAERDLGPLDRETLESEEHAPQRAG
jgi:putative glycosyltransferase (TIGR04372 family)